MFQLIYLRLHRAARSTAARVLALKNQIAAVPGEPRVEPDEVFADTVTVTMAQHHFRAPSADADDVRRSRTSRRRSPSTRIASPTRATSRSCSSATSTRLTLKPLVQRYLGGLPSINRKEVGKDVGIRPPTGTVDKVVKRGMEPQSQTFMAFTGSFEYSRQNAHALSSMAEILTNRLTDRLREAMGGTYGASASATATRDAPFTYQVTIRFGSSPDRVAELTKAALEEIQVLKDSGGTASDLEKIQQTQHRTRETALRQNNFWIAQLGTAYQYSDDPKDIMTYTTLVDGLTRNAIRDIARKAFGSNYVHISLVPDIRPQP